MNRSVLDQALEEVASALPAATPTVAVVCGSGWGDVVTSSSNARSVPYSDIPGLGATGVKGHAGRLLLADVCGSQTLVFEGRRHWYEGLGWDPIAIPVFLSARLGVRSLFLTNAAGGIRADLTPGSLMVIDDHINAMGANPLTGPHDTAWGPRFADMTNVYDADLRRLLDQAALQAGEALRHGVYLAASGPTYETPAEVRAYASMGADAVGMSTVPEAILGRAAGMRVVGISCITNWAAGMSPSTLNHAEVISETARAKPRMRTLLAEFFSLLAQESLLADSGSAFARP